jgi:dTDP-4-amino-4,6-dideoxygalactose transaminase
MNQHARVETSPVPFIDLKAQRRRLGEAVDQAIARVLAHGQYIMGPEVAQLEQELARFCGARHAISCASGTDALMLVLLARGIGSGDAVICPAFTFCATAEVVALVGATPVFADVDDATFNLDATRIERAVATAERLGLEPKAVIPVDLFGLPADHDAIAKIADAEGMFVLDDAAQAFGASYQGRALGTIGLATATSFFPAKPLGCYGDGGAIFTDDDKLAGVLRSLRAHGEGTDRYEHVRVGITGRLDTIQAAVLIEKLKIFREEIAARDRIARRYSDALREIARLPEVPAGLTAVWAQYTIRLEPGRRDDLAAALKAEGIPTAVYYRTPLHRQPAYREFPVAEGGLPVSERLADEVISLPMHAYLDEPTQDRIVDAVRRALAR